MSLTDDLFGSTDNSAMTNEWLWRKAVTDMMNAEYPAVQDWLNSGYNQGIGSTQQVYGMLNDRLTSNLADQISILSMVPGMSYNTLANGYNLAGQTLYGSPGSMLSAPQGGYAPNTYSAPQSFIPSYNPMLSAAFPSQMPAYTPTYSPAQSMPPAQSLPQAQTMPVQSTPQAPAPQASFQPTPSSPALTFPSSGFGTEAPPPGGFTENVDGQFTRKPGLDNVIDRINNPVPADLAAAQYNATSWQDPIYSTAVPWDNERGTGMGASPTNPYNYAIHTDSNLYKGLMERGVDADALFAQAKQQGVDPMRLVYQMQDPGLLQAVSGDFNSGRSGAAGVEDLARVAGISTNEMQGFLNGGQYVAPYENRDSIINLPEESRSIKTPEWFAAREGATTPQRQVIDDPNYRSPQDQAYYDKFIAPQSQTAPEVSAAQANLEAHQAELESLGSDRPTTEQQALYDQMTSQFGSSPAQGVRTAPTSSYSPLQAAIDATRAELAKNPGNTFAQEKLAEMEAQQGGSTPRMGMMKPESMLSPVEGEYIPGPSSSQGFGTPEQNVTQSLPSVTQTAQLPTTQLPATQAAAAQAGGLPATQPSVQSTAQPAAQSAVQPTATAQPAAPGAQYPWEGAQTYGTPLAGTGLQGSSDTYNAALNSANATLGMGGQSAVNAIGSGVNQGNQALTQGLMGGVNAIGSGANQGRNDLLNMTSVGFGSLSPYNSTGQAANTQMANLNGLNGNAAQSGAIQNVLASPEFDFYREQGNQGVLRNASALGGLGGGNVMKELSRFNQGLASTQFNNYYNRLSGMSGQGLQAAGQMSGLAGQSGSNLANLGLGMGTAQGALFGDTGQAMARNALTGGLAASDVISNTARGQAANTMGTGSQIGNNQYGTGSMLANMAFSGANTLANQYPGLANAGVNAYQNYGSLSTTGANSMASLLANLYSGQGQSLANNAYNRLNVLGGFGNYSQPVQQPGILGGLASLASGLGTGLGGYAAYANL